MDPRRYRGTGRTHHIILELLEHPGPTILVGMHYQWPHLLEFTLKLVDERRARHPEAPLVDIELMTPSEVLARRPTGRHIFVDHHVFETHWPGEKKFEFLQAVRLINSRSERDAIA